MPDVSDFAKERQIAEQAVKDMNRQWPENKGYAASTFLRAGKTTVYKVHFTDGTGNEEYDNWVTITNHQQPKAYYFLDTLMIDRDNGLFSPELNIDLYKLAAIAALAFMFSIAVIYMAIASPENKSLQVLTGLAGLTIGYIVGQSQKP